MFSELSDYEKVAIFCVIVVAGLFGSMLWNDHQTSVRERERAEVRCSEKDNSSACLDGVGARHDECFDEALNRGGRFDGQHLDTREYDYCVIHGLDAMREQRKIWFEQSRRR